MLTFEIYDGVLTGCSGAGETAVIPAGVTAIGKDAFNGNKSLREVTLPPGVTEIRMTAFCHCEKLKRVRLCEGLKRIGERAFAGCSELEEIELPDSLTDVEEDAFGFCLSLAKIRLPRGLTRIEPMAFSQCQALREAELPQGLKSIGPNAFDNCRALERLELPEGLVTIDSHAFVGCRSLERVRIPDSVIKIERYAFCACRGLKEVELNGLAVTVGYAAFRDCPELVLRVRGGVGPSLQTYLEDAPNLARRADFSALRWQDVPASERDRTARRVLERLERGEGLPEALARGWEKRVINSSAAWLKKPEEAGGAVLRLLMRHGAIRVGEMDTLMAAVTATGDAELINQLMAYQAQRFSEADYDRELERELREAELRADPTSEEYLRAMWVMARQESLVTSFRDARSRVDFPAAVGGRRVTGVADDFHFRQDGEDHMEAVEELTLPEGYVSVGRRAFRDCAALKRVTLPQGLEIIGNEAFARCAALERLVIPEGVTALGARALVGCTALRELTLPSTLTSIGEDAFEDVELEALHLPDAALWAAGDRSGWKNDPRWNAKSIDYAHQRPARLVLPEGLRQIGACAFLKTDYLVSVSIPQSVERIGQSAFSDCGRLARVTIPRGVKRLEERTFMECWDLKSVQLPEGLEFIGPWAFGGCVSLRGPALPQGLREIGAQAFNGCSALGHLTVPDSVARIGDDAFRTAGLNSISLPGWVVNLKRVGLRNETRVTRRHERPFLQGLRFSFLGDLQEFPKPGDLRAFITELGGECETALTPETCCLICNQPSDTSLKCKKARELGIRIISEKEFLRMARGEG